MTTIDRKDDLVVGEAAPSSPEPVAEPRSGRRLRSSLPEYAVPSLLVVTFVIFGLVIPDLFLTWTNIQITLAAQATFIVLALAVTFTLRAGDIDLSLAGTMVLSASVLGLLSDKGVPTWAACAAAILCAICVGLINCLFVLGVGLDSLIVTLGVFTALGGLTTFLAGSNLITTIPDGLQSAVNHQILNLPVAVWIGWVIAAGLWLIFEFTPLGRFMLFIGGNRSAGVLAGLRVNRLRAIAFVGGAAIAGVGGVLLAGTIGSVDPSSSGSYLLGPVTAAFLGTTCIQLGRFNIVGTLIGLYLIAFGITGLQLLGYVGWVTDVFNGVALVIALSFARYFEAIRSGAISFRRQGSATAASPPAETHPS